MKAVVLAAGLGTRLNPLTATRPKHLLPLGNSTILERVLKVLGEVGVRDVCIVVHYLKDKIINTLGSGERFNVNITYVDQGAVKGTAHAIAAARDFVGGEDFIAVYGDVTVNVDVLRRAIELYREKSVSAVMVGVEVDDPWNYGVLSIDDEGYLIRVVEKPRRGEEPSNLINAGIYVLDGSRVFRFIDETPVSPRGELEFTDTLQLLVNSGERIAVLNGGRGWWFDVGRPWDLIGANRLALSEVASNGVLIGGNVDFRGAIEVLPPVYIGSNSVIDGDCTIGPYTVICGNVRISRGTVIGNSVVMSGTIIGAHCQVMYSVLGENCIVENYVHFRFRSFDGGTVKMNIKGRRVDSGWFELGSVVGDGAFIGYGSIIGAGTSIYPKSIIPRLSLVLRDVKGVYCYS